MGLMIDPMKQLLAQLEFIQKLGLELDNFTQSTDRSFIFSHTCETDRGKRTQRRANFFEHKNFMFFHCYHCSESSSFDSFLKKTNPSMFREYKFSLYGKKKEPKPPKQVDVSPFLATQSPVAPPKIRPHILKDVIMLDTLDASHPIIKWVESRAIPHTMFSRLGYVEDFHTYFQEHDLKDRIKKYSGFKEEKKTPRIVIPYYDKDGNPFATTCRAIGSETPKYVYVFNEGIDKSHLIYGLWKLDVTRDFFVTEGQFDSMFLDNGISIGGANYCKNEFLLEHKKRVIIVPDNDWKTNKHIQKSLIDALEAGFRVSFLPSELPNAKDVNDIILSGAKTASELSKYLLAGHMRGLKAITHIRLISQFGNHRK